MTYTYRPKGVCSQRMTVELEDGIVKDVQILGGCNGNLQGIARLIKGRPAAEVADDMIGVNCSGRGTSCPDQIAKALKQMLA